MQDPLEPLLVNGQELDRQLLATVLSGLIQIDKLSGEIRLTGKAVGLPKKHQILVYLLGRKAAKAMDRIEEEAISPKEMERELGIDGGPLRGQLSNLRKAHLVQAKGGKYYVPNFAVEAVKKYLTAKSSKEALE